ncbi:MAG TPA: site-2 protease family protein [Tepidisphaeraceae bacterium]|nr:site-2 protease family protein [Tepidisphaeraceae bacterium]
MFKTAFKLPLRLFGIPLYLDISFLFVFPLMVWMSASQFAYAARLGFLAEPLSGGMSLLLGLVTAVGLFACVVLHELGHSLAARRYGVEVRRITLWFLGGVAEFREMPKQRGAEAVVAIAGPIVSFVLAAAFFGLALLLGSAWPVPRLVCGFLATINFMLAVFNLIPAMPMDGGRILRSLLALWTTQVRATAIAAGVAKVIALGMVAYGLGMISFAGGDLRVGLGVGPGNLWFIPLALFVYVSATREANYARVADALDGLRVRDLMTPDVHAVPAHLPVGALAQYVGFHKHGGFPVVDTAGQLVGSVSLDRLQTSDPRLLVGQIMTPNAAAISIAPDATAIDAAMQMSAQPDTAGRLVVTTPAGQLLGILTHADLARALHLRSIGMPVPTRAPEVAAPSAQHPLQPQPVTVVRAPQSFHPWSFPATDPAGFRTAPQRPIRTVPWYAGQ